MTLIIIGHEFEKKVNFSWEKDAEGTPQKSEMEPVGLFAVADSSITTPSSNGAKTVLGSFRKIYPVQIKIWKPHFTGVYFHSYQQVHYKAECFVAFAGSTLTAQHVLNLISEHLRKIRISYKRSKEIVTPGKYVLIRHCQQNELKIKQGIDEWDEDMFTSNDYIDLIGASDVAEIVEFSINEALNSARKYKIDEESLKAMYSEFAFGIYCPREKNHQLFVFRMGSRRNAEGFIEVFATNERIEEGRVAVLGMKKDYEAMAQDAMKSAIEKEVPPSQKCFDFLNQAIDKVRSNGSFAIDRPSVCKVFREGQLKTVSHKN